MLGKSSTEIAQCLVMALLASLTVDPNSREPEIRDSFVRGFVHGFLGLRYDDGVGIPHDLILCVPLDSVSRAATAYRRGFFRGRAARITNN